MQPQRSALIDRAETGAVVSALQEALQVGEGPPLQPDVGREAEPAPPPAMTSPEETEQLSSLHEVTDCGPDAAERAAMKRARLAGDGTDWAGFLR